MKPRLLWLCLICLLLSACASFGTHTLTVVSQSQAEAWTRPLSETPLRQTFILPANPPVSEIEIVLALPADAPALGTRPLTWNVVSTNNRATQQGVIETATYATNTPVRITFEPLPPGESIELSLTAPPEARLSLWSSVADSYPQGTIVDVEPGASADLVFALRAQETPVTLSTTLAGEAREWERAAQWLPLVLLAPGWLMLWLLGNGEGRPRAAAAAGLSLALIPLLYLWFAVINLHLYLPLARSLLSVAAALTLFVAVRRWRWLWRAWREIPISAVLILAFAIFLAIATGLLAGREYLAPPGTGMLESGLLAQSIENNGRVTLPTPPLPPAALTAFLATASQESAGALLLFSGFILAVAAIPGLFALGEEITGTGELATWLLPLVWLLPGTWGALANGDWFVLYSYALLPVTVALGLRALRVEGSRRRALFLAALPLGALFLVQGMTALATWGITLVLALLLSLVGDGVSGERDGVTVRVPLEAILPRGVALLFLSVTLLAPTLTQRLPVIAPPARSLSDLGYGFLLLAALLALGLRWLRPRLKPFVFPMYGLIVLTLIALSWWRSAPLVPVTPVLREDEQNVLTWMGGQNTPDDSQSLINLDLSIGAPSPRDGTFWSPLFNGRPTAYTLHFDNPALLTRVLAPGALEDALLRDELRRAGITHILLGTGNGPLRAFELQNRSWARLAYQSGSAYLFELVPPDSTVQ